MNAGLMASSALLTEPPRTYDDELIYRAISYLIPGWTWSSLPSDATYDDFSTTLIIGSSFALALITLITGIRLWARASRHNFGIDDWVIVPGALGCVVYHAIDIASATVGDVGRHDADCTYQQISWGRRVSNDS